MNEQIKSINLRVYGIVINEKHQLLVTDEFRLGLRMTKLPGGGLNPGEGTIDCLKREFMEELGQEIIGIDHFYTTDYFQVTSLLKEPQQLISIYYLVKILSWHQIETKEKPFDFEDVDGAQSFRWVDLESFQTVELTFPIDRKVLKMLKEKNFSNR
ncbi:MAG: NUDIX domain-containing protein [Bacteroidales bacterium]|nr:NUDIX domain-containing protein [Bacteroidales bacterium]